MKTIRIALAQLNQTVGDITENCRKIIDAIERAKARQTDLILFPELAITGYPPEDLLFKPDFIAKNIEAIETVAKSCVGIAAIVGFVDRDSDIYNAAAVIADGEIKAVYRKRSLPNYGVFDEERYFARGAKNLTIAIDGFKIGVLICEDLWNSAIDAGAIDAIAAINASPFSAAKAKIRRDLLSARARDSRSFILYDNLVGAQDELVFDGASAICDPRGEIVALAKSFEEDLLLCDLDLAESFRVRLKDGRVRAARRGGATEADLVEIAIDAKPKTPIEPAPKEDLSEIAAIYSALVLGLKDYARKNGFSKAVLGLSGGIDSALCAAIAADALGAKNVLGVLMPSPYSSKGSYTARTRWSWRKILGLKLKRSRSSR